MKRRNKSWNPFWQGLIIGILSALSLMGGLYVLNMLGLIAVSVSALPDLKAILAWAYTNLRLSIIPFTFILCLYFYSLRKLDRLLGDSQATPVQVIQTDNWINISISVFFGTGVIWTAIGMRSALIIGLSDLDETSVLQIGSFEILRRLVDGGILLALSTTIVGAMGGYLMRLNKILAIGAKLQGFYAQLADVQFQALDGRLKNIENSVEELVTLEKRKTPRPEETEI